MAGLVVVVVRVKISISSPSRSRVTWARKPEAPHATPTFTLDWICLVTDGNSAVVPGSFCLHGDDECTFGGTTAPGCQRHSLLPALAKALLWFLSPPPAGSPPRPQDSAGSKSTGKKESSFQELCTSLPFPCAALRPALVPLTSLRQAEQASLSFEVCRRRKWPRRPRSALKGKPLSGADSGALSTTPRPFSNLWRGPRAPESQLRVCSLSHPL